MFIQTDPRLSLTKIAREINLEKLIFPKLFMSVLNLPDTFMLNIMRQ